LPWIPREKRKKGKKRTLKKTTGGREANFKESAKNEGTGSAKVKKGVLKTSTARGVRGKGE